MPQPERSSPKRSTVHVAPGVRFGPGQFVVMAGPCAVESREQLGTAATAVREAGASMLRGGAFKPRTSPFSFQGLGADGLRLLAEVSTETGLPIVTEVMDPRDVELVARHAAILQIGSRNMQNTPLLREVGQLGHPVLLKRGAAATLDELLGAADHVLEAGTSDVILCERGIRSFDPAVRYTLDLAAVAELRHRSPLPVVVDPSHATGSRALVPPMALAALAAGADGLLVEVHPDPVSALSDGPQALELRAFRQLMSEIHRWMPLAQRSICRPEPRPTAAGRSRAEARIP